MSYVFDSNATAPDERSRRRRLAEALLARSTDAAPIQSPWQGAAKMATALFAGMDLGRLNKQDQEDRDYQNAYDARQAGGGAAQPSVASVLAAPAPAAPPEGGVTAALAKPPTFTGMPNSASLPAGMRNNNPGNIKYLPTLGYAGIVGPSKNLDQGDPQAVFATPEQGMTAAYQLALKKYSGGKTTANDLIAGDRGWTPGNFGAAKNIAALMGLRPDQDLNLKDPAQAQKFLRALVTQEHGGASKQYSDEMLSAAVRGRSPSAVTQALAGGAGTPVLQGGDDLTAKPAAGAQPAGMMAVGQGTPANTGGMSVQELQRAAFDRRLRPEQREQAKFMLQQAQKDPAQALQMQKLKLDIQQGQRNLQKPLVDPTTTEREYDRAKQEGFTGTLFDFKKQMAEAGRTSISVPVDASQKSESEFDKEVAKGQAKLFNSMAEEGVNAKAELGQIRALRGQISTLPGGFMGGALALASQYGIKLGPNASNIEAASAIISKLVPTQKAPGSGTISDSDLELFKKSLPALSNTPGGNAMIMDTMEALSIHKQRQAEIATEVLTGEKTRKEAMKALRDLPDPLEGVTKALKADKGKGGAEKAAGIPAGVDPKDWAHLTPEERALWK